MPLRRERNARSRSAFSRAHSSTALASFRFLVSRSIFNSGLYAPINFTFKYHKVLPMYPSSTLT